MNSPTENSNPSSNRPSFQPNLSGSSQHGPWLAEAPKSEDLEFPEMPISVMDGNKFEEDLDKAIDDLNVEEFDKSLSAVLTQMQMKVVQHRALTEEIEGIINGIKAVPDVEESQTIGAMNAPRKAEGSHYDPATSTY